MRMKKRLKQIAKKHGITVKEVREEMQKAIAMAWTIPPEDGGVTAAYQKRVPCKGDLPTPEELSRFIAAEIQKPARCEPILPKRPEE